jgi:hypothetical protein
VALADLVGLDLAGRGEFEALFGALLGLHLGHFAVSYGPKTGDAFGAAKACPARLLAKERASYRDALFNARWTNRLSGVVWI